MNSYAPVSNNAFSFIMSAPTAWPTVMWSVIIWSIALFILGAILHWYVTSGVSEQEDRRFKQVQLWFGTSGFLGILIIGCASIVVVFSFLFIAFYSRLIFLDVEKSSVRIQAMGEQFINNFQKFDFVGKILDANLKN